MLSIRFSTRKLCLPFRGGRHGHDLSLLRYWLGDGVQFEQDFADGCGLILLDVEEFNTIRRSHAGNYCLIHAEPTDAEVHDAAGHNMPSNLSLAARAAVLTCRRFVRQLALAPRREYGAISPMQIYPPQADCRHPFVLVHLMRLPTCTKARFRTRYEQRYDQDRVLHRHEWNARDPERDYNGSHAYKTIHEEYELRNGVPDEQTRCRTVRRVPERVSGPMRGSHMTFPAPERT